jgi:serine/threonine-protein kinase
MTELPEKIGKYKVLSLIARGGMGAVYKAVHPTLKREVVIKKLTLRGNASVRERFKREAKILLDLKNDHIVHMYDYFTEGSSHYIVLEFVDGMSLDVLLKKKKIFSN